MIDMGSTQHQQTVVGVAWLVELAFTTGTLRYTTAPNTITEGGNTWLGWGAVASVGSVTESEEVLGDAIVLGLSIVDQALIAASLGNVGSYRGRRATLYLQLLDATFQPVGPKVRRWAGVMDRVEIKRAAGDADAGGDGASTGTIEMRCSRVGVARMRNAGGLRLSHEQQQRRFPGDTGLQYVRTLIEKPALWLSKRFQER
ncbi:hypothetical protein KDK88_02270 [bacterium]|nr:hypothetical protein [bacterium]